MTGQTRIHLDDVESLGTFLELEVVLEPDQTEKEGIEIAERIMKSLGITKNDLVSKAYIALLIKSHS